VLDAAVTRFPCPYLNAEVELAEARERHITERHPDLLPGQRHRLATTLADPDQVRRSKRFASARLFSRWYDDLKGGKYVVVVVVSAADDRRNWVITAYIARELVAGEVEWVRS
jgi:hypothetical protein